MGSRSELAYVFIRIISPTRRNRNPTSDPANAGATTLASGEARPLGGRAKAGASGAAVACDAIAVPAGQRRRRAPSVGPAEPLVRAISCFKPQFDFYIEIISSTCLNFNCDFAQLIITVKRDFY